MAFEDRHTKKRASLYLSKNRYKLARLREESKFLRIEDRIERSFYIDLLFFRNDSSNPTNIQQRKYQKVRLDRKE